MPRRANKQPDGRKKFKRVVSLQKWLKAYGPGAPGQVEREDFARRVGTTLPYLVQVGLGNRRVSMELAVKLDRATYGQVSVEDLHPSPDWDYIAKRRNALAGGARA